MASGAAYGAVQRARAATQGKVAINMCKLGDKDAKSALVDPDLQDVLRAGTNKLKFKAKRAFVQSTGVEITADNVAELVVARAQLVLTKGEDYNVTPKTSAAATTTDAVDDSKDEAATDTSAAASPSSPATERKIKAPKTAAKSATPAKAATATTASTTTPAATTATGVTIPSEIDGSILEGGGQILRNSIAYSALYHRGLSIAKIRGGRPRPGLAAQHLTGLQLVTEISGGSLVGGEINSVRVTYNPPPEASDGIYVIRNEYNVDIGTAGSICLLIQTSLPVLTFAPHRIITMLKGGTNVDFSPQVEYVTEILRPHLKRLFNIEFDMKVERKGWFPRGGGIVRLTTEPIKQIPCFTLTDRGDIKRIRGQAIVSGKVAADVAKAMVKSATNLLRKTIPSSVPIDIQTIEEKGHDGCMMMLVCETTTGCTLGASGLGKKTATGTEVGRDAAETLLGDIAGGGCVDQHLQDQLILWMALAHGRSQLRIGNPTLHTRTAIHFAALLTGATFTLQPSDPENKVVLSDMTDGEREAKRAAGETVDVAIPAPAAAKKKGGKGGKGGPVDHSWIVDCTGVGYVNRFMTNE